MASTRCVRTTAALAVAFAVALHAPPASAQDVPAPYHRLPVDGRILRGFEEPAGPYGSGHRGLAVEAADGTAVRASAPGTVSFAGSVAGVGWVSVTHGDGVVTSHGPLGDIVVARGDTVHAGQRLGRVAHDAQRAHLHWGARRDGRHVDPASLLEPMPVPSLVGSGSWVGSDHVVEPYEPWAGSDRLRLGVHASPHARRPGYSVPPSPNHLVLLNGVATDSATMPVDPEHLGHTPESVTAFSYAGRRPGLADHDDPRRDQLPYGPSDTWAGVPEAARRLELQLRAIRQREPGRAVDLVGHSMGGVVALYYLTHLHDPHDVTLPPIGHVVTIASPHRGSDLADTGVWLRAATATRHAVETLLRVVPASGGGRQIERTPLDMSALDQLATGSSLLDDHARAWQAAVAAGDAGALAMGTRVLTIGASRDLVATPGRAAHPTTGDRRRATDAQHVVLPGGHDSVRHTEAVRAVVWDFLRGHDVDHASTVFTTSLVDDTGLALRVMGRAAALTSGPATDLASTRAGR